MIANHPPRPFHRLAFILALACLQTAPAFSQSPSIALSIDAGHVKGPVSPMLYGLMTEEINFSYDGGLYAELVRNRTFQDHANRPEHWFVHEGAGADASIKIDRTTGPSEALPLSLQLTTRTATQKGEAGIENEGFWGIPIRPKTKYTGSFYAKADDAAAGPVTVAIISDLSGKPLASSTVPVAGGWKRYDFTLTSGSEPTSANNRLRISVNKPGTLWFSLVSLFPPTYKNRVNGNRSDLMEKMAEMKPTFLRFPGGNYLEGDHINERFEWKKTIGPLVDRPTHPSPWRYHSSDGLGLLEFLGWCEDLKMEPLLAVYAGYSMKQEYVKPGPDLEPYLADALDEIEYVTGGPETKWGAQRAKDGHPAPFKMQYVEVGNEDWFDKSGSYEGRYAQFYKGIKAKYPNLQIIATMPIKNMKADVVDDHYYRSAKQFYEDVNHYDSIDRNGPRIFVGEWATREGSPTPNFGAALGDAAWMTGMERNSDLVIMASYAPLLVNVNPGGMQWESDLIGYDALTSYGSPSYYAQVMFGSHLGDQILSATLDGSANRFFYSVTRGSKNGTIYLKLVNASPEAQSVNLKLVGVTDVAKTAKMVSLSGKTVAATNTIQNPTAIVPVESSISNAAAQFSHAVPAYTIQVIELKAK
ncbi:MAG: Alpha-N-arabinofuranosidase [Acidobacteriaceae bacterium]|nr:Alpha-N-arabinofuranosidase [Acidobacteriaceae bacterium]